jgi:predicted MFS family arabinose efflux permease
MASAAYFSSIDTGFGLGSLMFGFVAESSGYYFVYWGAMIITALSLIAYLSGIVKRGKGRPVNSVS